MVPTITAVNPVEVAGFTQHRVGSGTPVYVRQDARFLAESVACLFQVPLDEETASPMAVLPGLLRRGTRSAPSQRELAARLESAFGASLELDLFRVGRREVLAVELTCLADTALPRGESSILNDCLSLLAEACFAPALDASGLFPVDAFAIEREQAVRRVESLIDDRFGYTMRECFRVLGEGTPLAACELGELDALRALTPADLTRQWQEVCWRAPLAVFAVGPVPEEQILDRIQDALRGVLASREPATLDPLHAEPLRGGAAPRSRTIDHDAEQAWLVRAYRTGVSFGSRHGPALLLADALLGQFMGSRLFREVRERLGLAYDVGSFLERHAGLLFMYAGLDADNADRCREEFDRHLRAIAHGDFDAAELGKARAALAEVYETVPDTRRQWTYFFFYRKLAGVAEHPEDVLRRISAVTPQEIAEVASAIDLDTDILLT